MKQISEVLREGIKRKQSVDAIIQANSLPIATSTAYRHIANHIISGISNIDIKRQVRYSPRGSSKPQPVPMDYTLVIRIKMTLDIMQKPIECHFIFRV